MGVNYNISHVIKNNKIINENDLKDIIAMKLLRVILAVENSVHINNS